MGTTLDRPASVLFGKTRRAVLSLLYGHPTEIFYLRQIARISETGLGAASDVDVMVIGDATFSEVVSALALCQEKLGREVNPTVYPIREFRSRLSQGHPFLREVLRQTKVFLIGNQRELSKLAKERLAR